jgi:shikimate kinase
MGGKDRSILLSGMMGAGKSTVGRRLAERLGWRFIDTDDEVASAAGLPVREIFARLGEPQFRELERLVLERLPERRAVVALGGGAVADAANRRLLRAKGARVLLEASPETLAERVGDVEGRPLLEGAQGADRLARLRALLEAREGAYASAELRVRTDGRTVDEVCDAVLEALGCRSAG